MTRKFRAARKAAKRPRSEAKPSGVWAPAKAGRRAKAIGLALAIGAVLCALLAACGHYGPPVRPEPASKDAAAAPATPNAPDASKDAEKGRDEP